MLQEEFSEILGGVFCMGVVIAVLFCTLSPFFFHCSFGATISRMRRFLAFLSVCFLLQLYSTKDGKKSHARRLLEKVPTARKERYPHKTIDCQSFVFDYYNTHLRVSDSYNACSNKMWDALDTVPTTNTSLLLLQRAMHACPNGVPARVQEETIQTQ